jgi:hypothetical protein
MATHDPRKRTGNRGEVYVREYLAGRGIVVRRAGNYNQEYDLFLDSPARLTIEVKAARWSNGSTHRYQANLRQNYADFVVLVCINRKHHVAGMFVIPFRAWCHLSHLKITQEDPERYNGQWRRFLNRWDLIEERIK